MFFRKPNLGAAGEKAARDFLRRAGFKILEANFRCPQGEIDLIALDGETIVFVEVKTLAADHAADPEDKIDYYKQRKLTQVARAWLTKQRFPERAYRFDAVAVVLAAGNAPQIRHIEESFIPKG